METGVLYRQVIFFQAKDGIRSGHVTGVQTCALPITDIAPASAAAVSRGTISSSVRPGIRGARFICTGIPARVNSSIAFNLFAGLEVRGSIVDVIDLSREVNETVTFTAFTSASLDRKRVV